MPDSTPVAEAERARQSGLPLPVSSLAGFLAALLAVAAIAFVTWWSLDSREIAVERVTRTLLVIERLEALSSSIKDAETGQRGFLLTGEERYLEPHTLARASLSGQIAALRTDLADDAAQRSRLEALAEVSAAKMADIEETIRLRRDERFSDALEIVRTDRGKALMDRIRVLITELEAAERSVLARQQDAWQEAVRLSTGVTLGGSGVLALLMLAAALLMSRDYRARKRLTWVRAGQMGLSTQLQGDQRLDVLGHQALAFLAHYLDAQVGAVYVAEPDGRFRRVAGYALSGDDAGEEIRPGDGLLGQAVRENCTLHVRDVPDGYLTVASSTGRSGPRELVIAPASLDGLAQAVVELGFFRRVRPDEYELLTRASETLAVAVRSARDRSRLEELLEETQRQAEALQTQQEELRVSNEELEEQAHALKESQARLETQQEELEQTNAQLEEQAQLLETQRDDLAQAQHVLAEKAADLERANHYKSEFLANMSHELRTPLNSSLILARLLADNKEGNLTAEQVRFANTISGAGNDLLALINDILDLSKIEAGKVEVSPEPVAVARAVDALFRAFEAQSREKGLGLSVAIESGVPDRIESDPQRLGQILKNLLSNALKFTEAGEVTLRVYAPAEGRIAFAVRDTGIGIPAHQQGLIFEAFRQADGSTHRRFGGTGLGLSISRDLARLLGGELSVLSAPGEGSTFTLTVPLVWRGPAQSAASMPVTLPEPVRVTRPPTAARTVPARTGSGLGVPVVGPAEVDDDRDHLTPGARSILVVEDDVRFAAILRDLAHERGFQCVLTHSANDGLAAAVAWRPSAIVLDVNLPDHSGLGVLDQLKRNPETRHIPVHVVSVADYAHEALERGAIGYALKPVKREDLVEAFRGLEARVSQSLRRVLIVEDDDRQRESIRQLLQNGDVQITDAANAREALAHLQSTTFDCMVMDLSLPDLSGYELLEQMAGQEHVSFPPVIVYTGRSLTRDEEHRLQRFSKSIIIKDARSPERLLDEVTLFLHQVESTLPIERQRMLQAARDRDTVLEGRRILVVEDDARNIFALSSVLEPRGAKVSIARNGREALDALALSLTAGNGGGPIDLVLMDIMMPEMDGLTAMREIRRRSEWRKLPIIALTAKAMKDDQEQCLTAGANDYIAKPLDVEKLLSLLRVWMPK
jgi:CheY-like chemotaxis protein/CHASE3 domain sensor protein